MSLDEGRDHVAFELLGVVEDVVVDTERLGDPPRVFDVSDRAAARVRGSAPELECGAHNLVALFEQEASGRR